MPVVKQLHQESRGNFHPESLMGYFCDDISPLVQSPARLVAAALLTFRTHEGTSCRTGIPALPWKSFLHFSSRSPSNCYYLPAFYRKDKRREKVLDILWRREYKEKTLFNRVNTDLFATTLILGSLQGGCF